MTARSRKSIGYLITTLGTGGAEKNLALLCDGLDRERYDPFVICLGGWGRWADFLEGEGIPVTSLYARSPLDVRVVWRLWRLLRDARPHLLHSFMFHANVLARTVGRAAGVPRVVCSERTMGQEGRLRMLLNHATARWADVVTANSDAVARHAVERIRLPPEKVRLLGNALDPAFLSGIPAAAERAGLRSAFMQELELPPSMALVGTVATLKRVKRIDVLLRAFAGLPAAREGPHALVIVGDGAERTSLGELVRSLGADDSVRFLGERSDVARVLSLLDLYVQSSDWEGMPNALLEAMAVGVPVVATDVGGSRELVELAGAGTLVPPGDPGALARALGAVLSDPIAVRAARAGASRIRDGLSRSAMVATAEAIYRELL